MITISIAASAKMFWISDLFLCMYTRVPYEPVQWFLQIENHKKKEEEIKDGYTLMT